MKRMPVTTETTRLTVYMAKNVLGVRVVLVVLDVTLEFPIVSSDATSTRSAL